MRRRYGVTVVAFKRKTSQYWDIGDPDVTLYADDAILIAGHPQKVEAFSELDKEADN
ncbi:TrkA C-terminal domain-containing protein [Brevibacterium linens]|uniref:TrkA C-terminal domain-containing protein n=1 Tax=Brevibacterium linens TaxID=1703 RepID=UPI003F8BE7DB